MGAHDLVLSPELALVDPELAAFARSLPQQPARWDVTPARAAAPLRVAAVGKRRRPRRLLVLSVLLNVALLAVLLRLPPRDAPIIDTTGRPATAAAPPTRTIATVPTPAPASAPAPTAAPAALVRAQERVLAMVGKNRQLRRDFVDPTTGLPYNGVAARCRPLTPTVLACTVERTTAGRRIATTVHVGADRS